MVYKMLKVIFFNFVYYEKKQDTVNASFIIEAIYSMCSLQAKCRLNVGHQVPWGQC